MTVLQPQSLEKKANQHKSSQAHIQPFGVHCRVPRLLWAGSLGTLLLAVACRGRLLRDIVIWNVYAQGINSWCRCFHPCIVTFVHVYIVECMNACMQEGMAACMSGFYTHP